MEAPRAPQHGSAEMGENRSGEKWPSREEIQKDPQRPANPGREGQGGYGGEGSDGVERRLEDEERERERIGHSGEEEGREPIPRK